MRSAARFGHQINTDEASVHTGVGRDGSRSFKDCNEQWLHVCATGHSGIRRFDVFAQFSLLDERAQQQRRLSGF